MPAVIFGFHWASKCDYMCLIIEVFKKVFTKVFDGRKYLL